MMQRMNSYGQPIGEEVENWIARPLPKAVHLVGQYVMLTKLSTAHLQELYVQFSQSSPSNWTYLKDEFPQDFKAFQQTFLEKMANNNAVYYVVIQIETNLPLGVFSLMRIDSANGVIEVGDVNFSDALKRTTMSTEAHFLLANYVFEELQYRRYEWKCDALNMPSIQTAKRLGFTYEGTFKHAVIYKNRTRDTSWFAMLAEDWPSYKQAYMKWLDLSNFDEKGLQLKKLQAFF